MSDNNRLRGLPAAAAAIACVLTIPGAYADPAADPDGEVLVSSTRLPEETDRFLANVTVITAKQIAATPAQTVADLLAMQSGIGVRSLYGTQATRATVDMRGFGVTGGQNTLILVDGRRLNDVDLSTVNYAALPLYNIERIEIVRGAGSVLYGNGASGGTINIVTRNSQREGASGMVGASGGSYGTGDVKGQFNYASGNLALHLAADGIESDGERDNNELSQRNFQTDVRYANSFGELYAKAGFSNEHLRLPGVRNVDPGASPAIDEMRTDRNGTDTPNDYAKEAAGFLTVGLTRPLGDNAGMVFDIGYRNRDQKAFFDDYVGFPPFSPPGTYARYLDTQLSSISVTPRVYLDHAIAGFSGRLTAGVDFYDYNYDSDRSLNKQTSGSPYHRLDIDQRSTAFYVSDLSAVTDSLSVNLGARIERVRVNARDAFDAAAPGAADTFETGAAPFSRSDTESMFEAGVGYKLRNDVEVFARASRSTRFATVDELFEFGAVFSPLDPQTGRHFDVGAKYAGDALDGSVTLYTMDIDHEIHFNPIAFTNENLDPTRRRGIEVDAGYKVMANLALRANATWQKAEFREGQFSDNEVPMVPQRMANLSALWTVVPDVTASVVWRYVGEKRFDNDETNTFGEQIPSYSTLDTKISALIGQWTVTGTVNNVFDKDIFDYGVASTSSTERFNGYPLPGRNFTLGASRRF